MAKRLLITGVSSGLGKAVAQYALETGWQVDALGRRVPDAPWAQDAGFRFFSVDLGELHAVQDAVAPFLAESYSLVIFNAGVLGEIRDMSDTPLREIERVMAVNTWANKCLMDLFINKNCKIAQIVAISSGASVSGSRGWNAYALSKAALNMLIQLYAGEMQQTHLCALAPGLIDTTMQDIVASSASDSRFPKMDQLKQARGTDAMPTPQVLAPRLMAAVKLAAEHYPSGSFIDIRKMELQLEGDV